ncbi:hypothetical protein [Marinithermus hydrothermalis]|uniref:Uncharacterized protein n=1 Tax=Marinithermus hydrothermalis (strain DSM 14884 / JCM 11576 / T1) TaxID=869210 RepID=F2NK84_MARHT|nr:hypothetical protein [Marinithermus hydrothermalis]AEB12055.1 hypothetical protein Marky_1318 [Marinithermus hydrothermalis DSM 14884]
MEEAERILKTLGYQVRFVEEGLEAERRTSGVVYKVFLSPRGELRLEKHRHKPEEERVGMLSGKNGQYLRREEVYEAFSTVAAPEELTGLLKAWES